MNIGFFYENITNIILINYTTKKSSNPGTYSEFEDTAGKNLTTGKPALNGVDKLGYTSVYVRFINHKDSKMSIINKHICD